MYLDVPLSDEEINELDAFLQSDNAPEACMDISTLDGFLTALVCSPEVTMPSMWLPIVWYDDEGPQFESQEQAQRIMDLIFRLQNSINLILMDGTKPIRPILYSGEHDGKTFRIAEDWSIGFLTGVQMQLDDWTALLNDKEHAESIGAITFLTAETEEYRELLEIPDMEDDLIDSIPFCVADIYDFWEERRNARPQGIVTETIFLPGKKPGRNDPCSCGSGKKFKKCCGAPQKKS
jgi:uncharacterized protein